MTDTPTSPPLDPAGAALIQALVADALRAARLAVTDEAGSDESPPVPDSDSDSGSDTDSGSASDANPDDPPSTERKPSKGKPSKSKAKTPKFTKAKPPSEALLKRAKLDTTDYGISLRLIEYSRGEVRYCPDFKGSSGAGWVVFDKNKPVHGAAKGAEGGGGFKFHIDSGFARASRRLVMTVRHQMLFEEYPALQFETPPKAAAEVDDAEDAKRTALLYQSKTLHRAGKNLGNTKNVRSVLEMARTLDPVLAEFKDWDRDAFKINTPGGLLTLPSQPPPLPRGPSVEPEEVEAAQEAARWTAFSKPALRPIKPDDLCTRITRARLPEVPETGADPHPVFTRVLETSLPDPQTRATFQRACGSCLMSYNPNNHWFLLQGKGSDGKSTLMKAIRTALGDYARTADVKTFLYDPRRSSSGPREDLMALTGANRMVVVSEPETGASLSDEILKQITGGDEVSTRGGHAKQMEFEAQFKLFLMCNEYPKVRGDDNGTWRRPLVIKFPHSVPVGERDFQLGQKLAKETDAILLWLFWGALDWWARGFDYAPSKDVQAATEKWRLSSSDLTAWAEERIIWGQWYDRDRIKTEDPPLYNAMNLRDGTRMTDAMAIKLETYLTTEGKPARYIPTDVYKDFEHWSHSEGKDPWNSRGFAAAFTRLAERRGAERFESNGRRWWRGFDFKAGFEQAVSQNHGDF